MRRTPLVILLVFAAAIAIWFTQQDRLGVSLPESGGGGANEADGAVVQLVGPGRATQRDENAKDAEPATDAAAVHARPLLWRGTVRVEGRPQGMTFDPPLAILVFENIPRFSSQEGFYAEASVTQTGAFEIDMRAALEEAARRHSRRPVLMRTHHPALLDVSLEIPLPDPGGVLRGQAAFPALDLVLRPAGTVQGTVFDVAGRPRREARVMLYRMSADGPERKPIAGTSADDDGRFELRFGSDGRYLLVATSQSYEGVNMRVVERPLPASEHLELAVATPTPEVSLRLRAAHTVRGVVRSEGVARDDCDVAWRLASPGRAMSVWKVPGLDDFWGLVYARNRVHWGWARVNTEEDGTFVVHGLSALRYRLRLDHLNGAHLHRMATDGIEQTVTPPQHNIVFDIRLAHVRVLARAAGDPLPHLTIGVSSMGMDPKLPPGVLWGTSRRGADARGVLTFGLSPKHRYMVTIRDERFEPFATEFMAPAVGETHEIVADLIPRKPRPRLRVTLEGVGASQLTCAGFGFFPADVDPMTRTANPVRFAKPVDGEYVLEDLLPGPMRLHVRPGRLWNDVPNDWLESSVVVDMPAEGDLAVRIPIAKGGRLHLTVVDPDGRHPRTQCEIQDASGTVVPVWFMGKDSLGGGTTRSRGKTPTTEACWVEPTLAAGTYTLTFDLAGHRSETRHVQIQTAETTTLRVEMQPTR